MQLLVYRGLCLQEQPALSKHHSDRLAAELGAGGGQARPVAVSISNCSHALFFLLEARGDGDGEDLTSRDPGGQLCPWPLSAIHLPLELAEQAFRALSPGMLHPSTVCLETGLMMRPPAL